MTINKGELIGSLSKTYGTDGRIILKFNPEYFESLKKTELVLIDINNQPVPFFISAIEFRNNRSAILKFHDYNSEEIIQEFVGHKIYFHLKDNGSEKRVLNENLKGYFVIDKKYGHIGIVQEIIRYSKNSLMRLLNKEDEILIPLSENIIINIDVANIANTEILNIFPDELFILYLLK